MITHYCRSLEDALKKVKQIAKQPGYDYWGITLPTGRKGFAVYKNGKLVERDALGNLTNDGRKGLVISYNVLI